MCQVIRLHHFGAIEYVMLANFHIPYEVREPCIRHATHCSLCANNFNGYLQDYGLAHSTTSARAVFLEGLLITVQHNPTAYKPWLLACLDLGIQADADTAVGAIATFSRAIFALSKLPVEDPSLIVNLPQSVWYNASPMERHRIARDTAIGLATLYRNQPRQFQLAA